MSRDDLPDFGCDLSSFIDPEPNERAAQAGVDALLGLSMVESAVYDPQTRTIGVTFRPYEQTIDVTEATAALLDCR